MKVVLLGLLLVLSLVVYIATGTATTKSLDVQSCAECDSQCTALSQKAESPSRAQTCQQHGSEVKCSCTYSRNAPESKTKGNSGSVLLMNWGTTGMAILLTALRSMAP